jgi:peroxiredoxin Q/BCP
MSNNPQKSLLTMGLSIFCLVIFSASLQAKDWTSAIAPDFKLQDQNKKWQQLKDYKGKWVVLYFYPRDDTPGCTTEAKNFRDTQKDFNQLKVSVLGVSIDSIESHKDFAEAHKLNFPLLSDESTKVSEKYQVLGGLWPVTYAKRQTFIIDPDGIIVKHYAEVNADKHAAELLFEIPKYQQAYAE